MLKVVFMGTPEFAVPALKAIHACADRFTIQGVYTQPDRPVGRGQEMKAPPVKVEALRLGLPVFQPEKLSFPGEYERLAALEPEIIVVVAFGQILRKNVLELPRLGCINIHSSLLPRWRGAAPIQRAILEGDTESGISTMHLVEKLDAGDVLLQRVTPIAVEDTAGTLHDRLAQIGAELIIPTLDGLQAGTLRGIPQDEAKVTHAAKLNKEMELLDSSLPAEVLDRRIRALHPWPGTSVMVEFQAGQPPERLKIKKAKLRRDINGNQGQLFERAGMLLLGTPQGSLELLRMQWDGKKETDAGSFLNGLRGRGQTLPFALKSQSS